MAELVSRPLIGITPDQHAADEQSETSYALRSNYCDAIRLAGGLPIILPYDPADAARYVALCDGVVITGGTPGVTTKPGRTEFEQALIAACLASDKPLLGICNGMQMIALALGGTLVQDVPSEIAGALDHIPYSLPIVAAHAASLLRPSRLADLADGDTIAVNSLHRQAVREGGAYRIVARAPDGVVEAIETDQFRFCLGVQWHPEYGLQALDRAIFQAFVEASRRVC